MLCLHQKEKKSFYFSLAKLHELTWAKIEVSRLQEQERDGLGQIKGPHVLREEHPGIGSCD